MLFPKIKKDYILTIGITIVIVLLMIAFLQKTIRPTKLQPQLFSLIKKLSKKNDYRVIVDKDNHPLCALISYTLVEQLDLGKNFDEGALADELETYYSDMPKEEQVLMDLAISDGC